jgi:prepilin-type N-terminal cleavage/methylation domain-containing protein
MLLKKRRRGFTLVELLVVLAIIGILVAMTTAAVMRFRGVGQARATSANLGKVYNKLGEQWQGVTDAAYKDSLTAPTNANYAGAALAGGSNYADPAVRKRYVALRQAQAFPTSFYEALWPIDRTVKPSTADAWPAYVNFLANIGITPSTEPNWPSLDVQQSICLLMILTVGPKNAGVTADDLGSAVGPVTLGNTTTRGIVDAWKQPVMFTRQFQGAQASLAVMSAGKDGRFGTDMNPKAAPASLLTAATQSDFSDNVLVSSP